LLCKKKNLNRNDVEASSATSAWYKLQSFAKRISEQKEDQDVFYIISKTIIVNYHHEQLPTRFFYD
jgi:hypothetical protein